MTTPDIAGRPFHKERSRSMMLLQADLPSSTRGTDLRCFRDCQNHLPIHLATAHGHKDLAPLLDPAYPLAAALGSSSSSSSVFVALGPPRLARLAATALHEKLAAALEQAATSAAASASGAAAAAAAGKQTGPLQQDCPVCLEQLGVEHPGVVLAPCCHALCLACCRHMHQACQEAWDYTRCPMCRAGVAGIHAWP
jgi:hypothetical protein